MKVTTKLQELSTEKKVFNLVAFATDVLIFRTEMQTTRAKFALHFHVTEQVIEGIESKHTAPRVELAFNLCAAMGKRLEDYFVDE